MNKKFTKLMAALALLVFMTPSMVGWGQTETLVSGSGSSGYAIPTGWSSSGTVEGGSYLKFDNGTITSPSFDPYTGLSFTYSVATFGSGTNHPLTIRILNASNNAVISEKTTATPTSSSYITTDSPLSLGDVDVEFKIQMYAPTGKGVRLRNYSVTGTPASGGGGSLTASDLALTNAPITLEFDLYNNSSAQTVSFTTSSTGEVTVSGGTGYVTTSVSGSTITVTPTAVTPSAQTITVSQEADATYAAGSVTFTVEITDSTPVPTHTATFSVNGTTTTQDFEEGEAIVFPADPADINGKSFVGWTTTAIVGTTNTAPTLITSATMGNSDITYYAVFAYVTPGTAQNVANTITPDTENIPLSYGSGFNEYSLNGVKFQILQMYKNSGKLQWRAAGNSNGTGTMYNSDAMQNIQSVVLTYNSSDNNKNFTLKVGNTANPTNGTEITPINNNNNLVYTFDCSGSNYDYFVLTNGSGAGYLDQLVINYMTGTPDTYSDYCTTVTAATVEHPVITVAENPFLFSTTVSMSCATEGATIYYTTDGTTDPTSSSTQYTAAFTINATTTIKAIAIKNSYESSITTVTATKNLAMPTVTIDATGITNTDVYTGTAAGSLAASVTYNEVAVEGASVTWSGNNDAVATIDASTGAVTLVAAGSVTFTATYAGNVDYSEKTATYQMTVTNSDPNVPGSENNPYTVAEARAAIDAGAGVTGVYATGIVSKIVTAYNSTYGNISYDISSDGLTTSDQLRAYRGFSYNGDWFTSADDIQVGDIVVIYGNLTKFNSTYEFEEGNQLVSLVRPQSTEPSVTVTPPTLNVDANALVGNLGITYENLNIAGTDNFDVNFYEADGTTDATYNWLDAEVMVDNNEYVVHYTIQANTGEARTAYMKVYVLDEDAVELESDLITVTQAAYVAPEPASSWVWIETSLADLTSDDVFVIVGTRTDETHGGNYAMSNNNSTGSAPAAIKVTVIGNHLSGSIGDTIQWTLSSSTSDNVTSYTFYPNGSTTTWLYCTNTNNGVRVGTNDNKVFTINDGYLKHTFTSRYVGIYNSQDWRCYSSTTGNIAGQTFKFYKRVFGKEILPYGDSEKNNYYLIASPVGDLTPTTGNGFIAENAKYYDLYSFDESQQGAEWRNYKVMTTGNNPEHANFSTLVTGNGYLYASKEGTALIISGTPYTGSGAITLKKTENMPCSGWNLIGNPFATAATLDMPFYKMNDDGDGFTVKIEDLTNPVGIMEGVFVQATATNQTATFTAQSKGGKQSIAKVEINVSGSRGTVIDNAIVRFDKGETLEKFMLNPSNTRLYFTEGSKDYAIVRSNGQDAMPVNFKASQNGTYTLSVNAENLEMDYLHLIDNMTGTNVDLLATPSYTFEAKTTDYASRFRLVFNANEENGASTGSETFAFFNGNEWMISNQGEATLQVIDVLGRVLSSETISGTVTVSLKETSGVYMLRLVNGNDVKVQKVVVR